MHEKVWYSRLHKISKSLVDDLKLEHVQLEIRWTAAQESDVTIRASQILENSGPANVITVGWWLAWGGEPASVTVARDRRYQLTHVRTPSYGESEFSAPTSIPLNCIRGIAVLNADLVLKSPADFG